MKYGLNLNPPSAGGVNPRWSDLRTDGTHFTNDKHATITEIRP